MVNRAQAHAVRDLGLAAGIAILDDVRSVKEADLA
jgi:hypothetical protein